MSCPDSQDEAGRLLRLVKDILPPPLYPKDAYEQVVVPTALAEGNSLMTWIEAAILPAVKRARADGLFAEVERTVPAAGGDPRLSIRTGRRRFRFEVSVIPMESVASFAWLVLREDDIDLCTMQFRLANLYELAALAEIPEGWEWRYIPDKLRRQLNTRLADDLPIAELKPLLPVRIQPCLDLVVQSIIEDELAHRQQMAEIRKRDPQT